MDHIDVNGINVKSNDIERFIEGVDYPAKKADLMAAAKKGGANNDVTSVLARLPDKAYASLADVAREIAEAV